MKNLFSVDSKLPHINTSIFAIMSRMANEHTAINLSQGFPDFNCSNELIDLVNHFMNKGFNQYAPMPGTIELRNEISRKISRDYGKSYNPDTEISITAGATQALFTAFSTIINPGDEVIIFPTKTRTRVKSIEIFHKEKDIKLEAEAGESIGLTLEDDLEVRRGQVICAYSPTATAQYPWLTTRINTNIFWISPIPLNIDAQSSISSPNHPTTQPPNRSTTQPLNHSPITIRCATTEEICSIDKIETKFDSSTLEIIEEDGKVLGETEVGKVVISIEKPMVFEDFNEIEELGRFVLVKEGQICAGGIITDIDRGIGGG